MRVVIAAKPWLTEPALIPLPWNSPEATNSITSSTHLKIAIMKHDNVVLPHPPITRILSTLSEKLSSIPNITVVPWEPHLHDEAWAILSSLYYPDGGAGDRTIMDESGEPTLPLTDWMLNENPCVKVLSPQELSYWLEEREEYRREYAAVWNKTGESGPVEEDDSSVVDVVLCPVGPSVANRLNTAKYWGYTAVWNLLDYPAASFPVDKVDREVDRAYSRGDFMSGADKQNWKLCKRSPRLMRLKNSLTNHSLHTTDNDNPQEFHGLPVSLQLVGRRFEDEKVLAVLEYLYSVVRLPFCEFP